MRVFVTVSVGHKSVPLDQVTDQRVVAALRQASQQVGRQLDQIRCPTHQQTASRVRIHFDQRGNADLKYDSCCSQLGQLIGSRLG